MTTSFFFLAPFRAGASGYLNKEMAPEELVAAIRLVMGGRKYVSAAVAELLASSIARGAGTPHDQRNIGGRVMARAVERAGLEAVQRDGRTVEPAPTFHSLRHSHGSALIAAGWDIEEISARLGHSNVATTQRTDDEPLQD